MYWNDRLSSDPDQHVYNYKLHFALTLKILSKLWYYDVVPWNNLTMNSYKRMKACYIKYLEFVGYSRSDSVTTMLAEIDIPDFDSVINNFKCAFKQ